MTITPPVVGPIDVSAIPNAFRAHTDVQPFTYRSAMTYTQLLESMRVWTLNQLIPYLSTNFEDIQGSWVENVTNFVTLVNAGLAKQSADNAAKIADALTAISTANIQITDPAITAVLNAASSQTKAWLDQHYGSGITDKTVLVSTYAGLVSALSAAVSNQRYDRIKVVAGSTITVPAGASPALTIDAGYAYVDFNGCTVNATAMTSGVAVKVTGSVYPPYRQTANGFDNLVLLGPGQTVAGTIGIQFEGDSTTTDHGPSHIQPQHVNVSAFETGVINGNNVYCLDLLDWDIYRCITGYKTTAGLPTEERLTFTDTNISNCSVGIDSQNGSGDLYLFNCSIDYNGDAQIKNGSWQIDLFGCHVETGDKATPDFTLQGNGSRINLHGGSWTNTKNPTWDAPIVNNANNGGGMFIDGTHLGGLGSVSGYLATGTGLTRVQNTTGYDNTVDPVFVVAATANLLADGGFEQSSVVDPWQITADTATIGATNQLAGANINMSVSTNFKHLGNQSLKITKVGGNGSAASCAIWVPIPRGQRPRLRFFYKKGGTQAGSLFVTVKYSNGFNNPANGLMKGTMGTVIKTSTLTFTSTAVDWTVWQLTEPTLRPPMWATHVTLEFGLGSMAAGDFYVDDVEVTTL